MRKLNLLFLFSILSIAFFSNSLHAATIQSNQPLLKSVISKLQKQPDSNQMIQTALQEGSINVRFAKRSMPFRAMWNNGSREIIIDGGSSSDEGEILVDVLFELMNAVSEPQYQALIRKAQTGQISCDEYVETVERIEHNNMIKTESILRNGVKSGVFPKNSEMIVVYDFSVHYKIQQLVGHSLQIVNEYRSISPAQNRAFYRGTVNDLNRMSHSEKLRLSDQLFTDYFRSQTSA